MERYKTAVVLSEMWEIGGGEFGWSVAVTNESATYYDRVSGHSADVDEIERNRAKARTRLMRRFKAVAHA